MRLSHAMLSTYMYRMKLKWYLQERMESGEWLNSDNFCWLFENCVGYFYCIHNPETGCVHETRDVTWLHHRFYGKMDALDGVVVYPQVSITFKLKMQKLGSKNNKLENGWHNLHTQSCRVVIPPYFR